MSRLVGIVASLITLPLFIAIYIILHIFQGRPIFYKGLRLGKHGREFYIYKFRTMVVDAEMQLNGQVASLKSDLKTPMGRFLRKSRLDELPQLWNLVKGDMLLFGPRPLRESIYATMGDYPHYYERLSLAPGLFGPTQVFLPHTAPKPYDFDFYAASIKGLTSNGSY